MIKKAVIGAGLAAGLGFLVFGGSLFSYLRTSANEVRESIRGEVPLEFEIKRARDMVGQLVPEMHQCMRTVAEQETEIEYMRQSIDERTVALRDQRMQILALRDHLDGSTMPAAFQERGYSRDDVARKLKARFERFKVAEQALERDTELLAAREQALAANQAKLDEMLTAKEELEVKVAQAEARLQTLRATQAASELQFDDSQLAHAKALIREINKQIDVDQKLLDAHGRFADDGLSIPVEEDEQDVAEQIDAYFGSQPDVKSADVHQSKPAA